MGTKGKRGLFGVGWATSENGFDLSSGGAGGVSPLDVDDQ